jgi:shikimate 5-dehydrogenase
MAAAASAEFTLPEHMLQGRPVVFDAAYKPARTALLDQVR